MPVDIYFSIYLSIYLRICMYLYIDRKILTYIYIYVTEKFIGPLGA